MSSRGRRSSRTGGMSADFRRRRRQPTLLGRQRPTASDTHLHRRRTADAQWRSAMTSCFDTLRVLINSPERHHRRHGGRGALLRAAADHLRYLEGELYELLRDSTPHRTIETVRAGFLDFPSSPGMRTRQCSRQRRDSCDSEEVILSLEDLVPEEGPKAFTGVRGQNVVVCAANARAPLGDITNAQTGSTSRPARCGEVASSERIGRTRRGERPPPRADGADSFYGDGSGLPPSDAVAAQVVPGTPPDRFGEAGPSSFSLLEALQVVPSSDVTAPNRLVAQVPADATVIVHEPMLGMTQSPGQSSPGKSPPLFDAQSPERWILGSELDWMEPFQSSQEF